LAGSVLSPVQGKETAVVVAEADVPIAMGKVYRRLERWRRQCTGRSRIPESVWRAAGELALEHGVNAVSRVLRLEFNHLKRAKQTAKPGVSGKRTSPPAITTSADRR